MIRWRDFMTRPALGMGTIGFLGVLSWRMAFAEIGGPEIGNRLVLPPPLADDVMVLDIPGVRVTKVYRPDQVNLSDDHFVIGVVINGQARAYVETGMYEPENHIAYDRLGGTEIAVAFCSKTGDSRVFCGDRETVESIWVGGWRNYNMELLVGDQRHSVDAKNIPVEEVSFRTMAWSEWKALFPTTDVYLGDLNSEGYWNSPLARFED